ncbi:HsdM family class I SAM-dependent methyltransferase [Kerstersia similis]|uniref:HsdM family class I SAM-dependent methyltransferase n=1 Tax=Kerstersia similis TaxID=206505 RepID=UPI0039F0904C
MAKAGAKKDRLINIDDLEELNIEWPIDSTETPEQIYVRVAPRDRRSFLGQFFTPVPLAKLMANWITSVKPETVLDPSVGPGILTRTVRESLPDAKITCIDIDQAPLQLARMSMAKDKLVNFIKGDFLTVELSQFDAILANPPYLRHQNLYYDFDVHTVVGNKNGVKLSRRSNLYVLFILEICRKLRDGGRASIIVPAEWMNANFGAAIKKFFHSTGYLRQLIYFSHDTFTFEDALTTAAILLIEKSPKNLDSLDVIYVEEAVSMPDLESLMAGRISELPGVKREHIPWHMLLATQKWDQLFAMGSHKKSDHLIVVETLAKSRRGIATGANDFFHLRPSQTTAYGIQKHNQKICIGRAQDVKGLIFSKEDLFQLEDDDARTRLISFGPDLSPAENDYISEGIAQNLNTRYLLAARSPWYSMENRDPAPIWAAVFSRGNLRFVLNAAGAYNLTTFHCLYPNGLSSRQVKALVALLNAGPIQERAMRHRRVYGGGLAKFEPKDLLQLEVPDIRCLPEATLDEIISLFVSWDREFRNTPDFCPTELNLLAARLIDQPTTSLRQVTMNRFTQEALF